MKKIIIIGNGLSAWSVANAFLNKNVQITIIGKKKSIFGAQQLSPNGFKAVPAARPKQSLLHRIAMPSRSARQTLVSWPSRRAVD